MERDRRIEIDILKALAVIGVVEIHLAGSFFPLFLPWSREWNLLVIFDQISRFSVPLFVALSGSTLAAKYCDRPPDFKDFYLRRVTKILPLYLLWAGASYILAAHRPSIWDAFIFGKAEYHLYFVPMIFQLYLLFPILLLLTKKFPKIILVLALILQIYLFQFLFPSGHWSDQEQYLFSGTWLFYFILGIYLAVKESTEEIMKKLLRFLSPGFLLAGFFWAINNTFSVLRIPADLIIATRFTKLSILTYATGVIMTGVYRGKMLQVLPQALQKVLAFIGRNSYLIYLSHVLILRIVLELIKPKGSLSLMLVPILVVVPTLTVSILLPKLSKRARA